jgi:hypothetical protein
VRLVLAPCCPCKAEVNHLFSGSALSDTCEESGLLLSTLEEISFQGGVRVTGEEIAPL